MFFNLLLIFSFAMVQGNRPPQTFDRATFYKAIAANNKEQIDAQLSLVTTTSLAEKEAYEGTLLMKKAGMAAKAKEKLSLFKAGRQQLENAISKNNTNTEYRFLRLIIQEHAPKVVKYRNKLEEDSQDIRTNFKSLSPTLQQIILDYNKKSTILKIL